MLDTKESRRAAALALAARTRHSVPEREEARWDHNSLLEAKVRYRIRHTSWDAQRLDGVESSSASKMIYPNNTTRGINYETTRHPNPPKGRGGKAPRTKAYRGRKFSQVVTHVNPVETGIDFFSGNSGTYSNDKYTQSMRNVANADKICGADGYGYSTGRAVPHILAKICAYAEEDKKAWAIDLRNEFDRKVLAELDAKAMRVYGKTQFAGNDQSYDDYDDQYYALGQDADFIAANYRNRLFNDSRSDYKSGARKGAKDELEAHDERVLHYRRLGNAKKYGNKYEPSEKFKYHQELNRYKTDKARGYKPGDTIDMGKKWRRKDNGEYEVTNEPDSRIMGNEPEAPKKKRKGLNVKLKRRVRDSLSDNLFAGINVFGDVDAPFRDAFAPVSYSF